MPVFSWTIPAAVVTPPAAEVPVAYSAAAYAQQLFQLLPRGILWTTESDSKLRGVLLAIGDELARVDARGLDLIEETDPRTATETIEDWERILALPDDLVTSIPATLPERRIAITQKFVRLGGQNVDYFVRLALACGYVLDPTEPITLFANSVLRVGFRVSDRVYGDAYAYAMQVNVMPPTGTVLPVDDFERVIRHATHSHIVVIFNYL